MKIANALLFVVFAFGAAASLPAQVDMEHSIARFSFGSGPSAVEVGVGRVSGNVVFDSSDAADPSINLNIRPDKSSGADYSEISFKSKRSAMTSDGKLAVIGDLSVTRVEYSMTLDPNEGYHGAVYDEPIVHTDSREVTLVLPNAFPRAAQNKTTRLSASIKIGREGFPQLLGALAPGNWPKMVVEDENCTGPSTVGEDYSGAICTGRLVATAANGLMPATVGVGEGYYGFEPVIAPDGSQATIALDLSVIPETSAQFATSAKMRAAGK